MDHSFNDSSEYTITILVMKTVFFFFALFFSFASFFSLASPSQAASAELDKSPQEWVRVYKYSAKEDCGAGAAQSNLHAMQKTLKDQGIPLRFSGTGHDGLIYSLNDIHCVASPTIFIFEIPQKSYPKIVSLGFQNCKILETKGGGCYSLFYSDRVGLDKNRAVSRIYKYAGQKQCQEDSGTDIALMEQELIDNKVVVFKRYKGVDGLTYQMACGHESGEINIYVVDKLSLAIALSLGYRECAYLEEELGGVCHHLPLRRL